MVSPRTLLLLLLAVAASAAGADQCATGANSKRAVCLACDPASGCKRCAPGFFFYVNGDGFFRPYATVCCPNTCSECDTTGKCKAFDNPLLTDSPFPRFQRIKPSDVSAAAGYLSMGGWGSAQWNAVLQARPASFGMEWQDPLTRVLDRFKRAFNTAYFLAQVMNTPELRDALSVLQYQAAQSERQRLQDPRWYAGLQARQSGGQAGAAQAGAAAAPGLDPSKLTAAQKRVVELAELNSRLQGAALQGSARDTFNAAMDEINQLMSTFNNNLLDSTAASAKLVTSKADVQSVPDSDLEVAANQAKDAGNKNATTADGPWLFSLDTGTIAYNPLLACSNNRTLREEVYHTRYTVASSTAQGGKFDNTPTILRLLKLRADIARLMALPNYASYSALNKMATAKQAADLEEQLRKYTMPVAQAELNTLKAYAKSKGFNPPLQPWDQEFFARKLQAETQYSDEELREYLSLPVVLDALFATLKRLFGADVVDASGEQPVWHPDVRFYNVTLNGRPKGFLYLDPYRRPGLKSAGAFTYPIADQSRLFAGPGAVRLPAAAVVTNFQPPTAGQPAMLTWDHVLTIFHEMGHAMQVLLTTQVEGQLSGKEGVEWDAVEFPSQFMERWLMFDTATIKRFKHYQTSAPIPPALVAKLLDSRLFRSATRQSPILYQGIVDLTLHSMAAPPKTPGALWDADRKVVSKTMALLPPLTFRRLTSFTHIFAGGYASSYYAYKWSEVMSQDAFAAFREAGLGNEAKVKELGQKFLKTVLQMGGSLPAGQVFRQFRGRAPSIVPLLKCYNLTST